MKAVTLRTSRGQQCETVVYEEEAEKDTKQRFPLITATSFIKNILAFRRLAATPPRHLPAGGRVVPHTDRATEQKLKVFKGAHLDFQLLLSSVTFVHCCVLFFC